MPQLLDSLPEDRRDAAGAAIAAAFGASSLAGLSPILGGASGALAFRIEVGGRTYALRLDRLTRDLMRNPERHYACMAIAAEAGLAPALHHADPAAAIAIMDFIDQKPLSDFPGGSDGLARELGGFLGRLQQTPLFPAVATFQQVTGGLLAHVQGTGLFAAGLIEPHLAAFARLREAYPWDAQPAVSSHNDPNFRNLLFDGDRLWLIDWETAYRNDPLVDLAIVANELEAGPERATALLAAWHGAAPSPALQARLLLMRQMTRLYYAALIFSVAAALPREGPITDLDGPTGQQFRADALAGRYKPGDPATMLVLGKLILRAFLEGAAHPDVERALARARDAG